MKDLRSESSFPFRLGCATTSLTAVGVLLSLRSGVAGPERPEVDARLVLPTDDLQPHMPQTVAEATAKGSKVLEFNSAHPGFNAQPSASRVLGCSPGTLQLHGSNMDLEVLGFQVSGAQTWNPGAAEFRVQELKLPACPSASQRASPTEPTPRHPCQPVTVTVCACLRT